MTVEEALSELRLLFPEQRIEIEEYYRRGVNSLGEDYKSSEIIIWVGSISIGEAQTLSDCMSQVRAWAKERK